MVFKAVSEKIDFDAVKESTTLTGEALAKKQARDKELEAIIKGENIPEPGIPESFKVLLKELQSLGLDVRVLRDDNTEVEIMETSDMGETSFRSLIEGDGKYRRDEEDFGKHGYTTQEFQGEELVNEELEEDEDDYDSDYGDDSFDDYDDMSDDE